MCYSKMAGTSSYNIEAIEKVEEKIEEVEKEINSVEEKIEEVVGQIEEVEQAISGKCTLYNTEGLWSKCRVPQRPDGFE